jgi:hypothetical protein
VLTQLEAKVELNTSSARDSLQTLLRFRERHEELVQVGTAQEEGWMNEDPHVCDIWTILPVWTCG